MFLKFVQTLSAICFIAFLAAACGKEGIGTQTAAIPLSARTIHLAPLTDKTNTADLALHLDQQMERDITMDGRLHTVTYTAGVDLILSGEIQRYIIIPLKYDEYNVPYQFKMKLVVDVKLRDAKKNLDLWSTFRTVHITPVADASIDHGDDDYDSLNYRSLVFTEEFAGNNSVGLRTEFEDDVLNRLLQKTSQRVLQRIITAF